MSKADKMPYGILGFLVAFLALAVYYFFYDFLFLGLYAFHGYTISSLTHIPYLGVALFVYILVVIALAVIVYGFINRLDWTRKFAILFLIWAALWPLWGMIIGSHMIGHLIIFIIYMIMIYYLTTEYVKKYFIGYFRYGDYILYKRVVTLKSGKTLTIYFFSKHTPESGTPSRMPDGYEVGISARSGMPYLQKIGKPKPYKYGDYTLYKRRVTLKSGKTLTIYFFSGKKPKSGEPTTKPEGYVVGVNERSKLPYLRKRSKLVEEKRIISSEEDEGHKDRKKPSNVIYVVSKPQPGQVKGDWAVRSHGKIYSHHRKKENAIKQARKIAKERDATVMVQNTDGTFSMGFKPKKS
jgi:hypothetical protein